MQLSKNEIKRVVHKNVDNIAGSPTALSNEQLLNVVSESVYEILEKYDREIRAFINARVS